MAERVVVMYAGQIVEEADVKTLFAHPLHPYTQGLLGSIPVLGRVRERLDVIPGSVPNLLNPPPGCRFEPRCEMCKGLARERCKTEVPPLREIRARPFGSHMAIRLLGSEQYSQHSKLESIIQVREAGWRIST